MDTLEAVSTLLGLWPKSFTPLDKWRETLIDELDEWSRDERRAAVETLKLTHNGRKVSIDTLRAARAKPKSNAASSGSQGWDGPDEPHGATCREWLKTHGLWDSFLRAPTGDKVMIRRLIAAMYLAPDWQHTLLEQAGSGMDYKPWDRIENLVHSATNARYVDNSKVCAETHKTDGWKKPLVYREVFLPSPPQPVTPETRERILDGWRQIRETVASWGT